MWRCSFQRAMGLEEQNRLDEVREQLRFLSTIDPASIRVAMDPGSSTLLAFMVLTGRDLDHLYVHVDHQGSGIGTALLNRAKRESPEGLELFTFQRNHGARRFYKRRGFEEVRRGFARLEENPWATGTEQLADIQFRWRP